MLVSPRHSWRSRVVAACLLLALPLAACHPASNEPRRPYTDADRAEALAGLPPAKDPPLSLDDEDDLERARGLYEAMPVAEDGRAARRAELVTAYVAQIDLALATSNLGAADEAFANAIGMWTMGELADEKQAAAGLAALEPTARKLYGVFARAGKDLEAATALVVIAAADPAQLAYCERVLAALMDFADDLQLATRGPGARHARPIAILEAVSARFASPWPARLLGLRYLDRQALWVKGANDPKLVMAGAQDPGIEAPVWALTRAYARMGKLALLPRVLDQIAGQRGDNPELRKIVTSAAGPEAKVDELVLLAQGFLDPRVSSEPDLATARRLAEIALERFPESDQPRRILGLVALQQGYYPLAERLLESVLRVAPTDKNVAELHARVLLAQMFDALGAERLTAADERRTRLEAIMADAKTRWKDQVFEPGLGDVWSAYGRGLYAQGRIDDAVTWLNKANAVKPSDGALETLGQIYVRRGRYQEAVAAFDAAARAAARNQGRQARGRGAPAPPGRGRAAARRRPRRRRDLVARHRGQVERGPRQRRQRAAAHPGVHRARPRPVVARRARAGARRPRRRRGPRRRDRRGERVLRRDRVPVPARRLRRGTRRVPPRPRPQRRDRVSQGVHLAVDRGGARACVAPRRIRSPWST